MTVADAPLGRTHRLWPLRPWNPPYYHRVRLVPSMGEASTAGGATTQRKNEGTSRSHGEEALKKKG